MQECLTVRNLFNSAVRCVFQLGATGNEQCPRNYNHCFSIICHRPSERPRKNPRLRTEWPRLGRLNAPLCPQACPPREAGRTWKITWGRPETCALLTCSGTGRAWWSSCAGRTWSTLCAAWTGPSSARTRSAQAHACYGGKKKNCFWTVTESQIGSRISKWTSMLKKNPFFFFFRLEFWI